MLIIAILVAWKMRVLLLHAERFSYTPTKKAVSQADEEAGPHSVENALVVFTTVEDGDDEEIVRKASQDIAEHAAKVKADIIVVYPYAHLSSNLAPLSEARQVLSELAKSLENLGLKVHKAPFGWYKAFDIKVHGHPLAELSRSYSATERMPPLMETTRDFEQKLYNDYLQRFGLTLGGKATRMSDKWRSALEDVAMELRTCDGETATVFTKDITAEKIDYCTEYLLEGVAQPIRAFFIERGIPTTLDKLKSVIGEEGLVVNEKHVWLQGKQFKFLVGLSLSGDKTLAFMNTILAGMIAMNIEKMQSSQYIPMLPIKYSVVQAYIAINNPVSSEYASLVASKVRKKLKRVVVDDSDSKLAEKLRRAGMLWAPYVIVVGKREEESRAVSIRRRADGTTKVVPVDELEEQLY